MRINRTSSGEREGERQEMISRWGRTGHVEDGDARIRGDREPAVPVSLAKLNYLFEASGSRELHALSRVGDFCLKENVRKKGAKPFSDRTSLTLEKSLTFDLCSVWRLFLNDVAFSVPRDASQWFDNCIFAFYLCLRVDLDYRLNPRIIDVK